MGSEEIEKERREWEEKLAPRMRFTSQLQDECTLQSYVPLLVLGCGRREGWAEGRSLQFEAATAHLSMVVAPLPAAVDMCGSCCGFVCCKLNLQTCCESPPVEVADSQKALEEMKDRGCAWINSFRRA